MKELAGRPPKEQASFLVGLVSRLRGIAGGRNGDNETLRDAVEELIDERIEEGHPSLTEQERDLLLNALTFGELQVADVMVPRSDVHAVAADADLDEVVRAMQRAMHSRLLVFRETLDDVVGMVHIKDLLRYWGDGADFRLERTVRPVLYVPPSMPVLDLMLEMRAKRVSMAVVVDEYGGTDGLATLEDLVEEIVGEIQDEHERILPPQLVEAEAGALLADARVELEELERRLGTELIDEERREDVDTLGGLIFTLLGRVPARGELVRHPAGVEFEVMEADPRRVKRVRVLPAPPSQPAPE